MPECPPIPAPPPGAEAAAWGDHFLLGAGLVLGVVAVLTLLIGCWSSWRDGLWIRAGGGR